MCSRARSQRETALSRWRSSLASGRRAQLFARVSPPAGHDLAVVLLAERRAERDQREPVGAGLEVAHHARADPEDVPLPQVVHLVVELDAARALPDHVDLLLLRVRVPEWHA